MKEYLIGVSVYNEGEKIRRVIRKFNNYEIYDVLIVDDGSTDHAVEGLPHHPAVTVLSNDVCRGAGFTTRQTIRYAQDKHYKYIIFVSGNDKDDSGDILQFVDFLKRGYDFVQGSRFLKGGQHGGMPYYRKVATRFIHPGLISFVTGMKITDSTNGFRAVRTGFFDDPRMNIEQQWLDQYELEPYLLFYAIRLGYKTIEVPVTKIYPPKAEGYTKMKPWTGWWSILRPVIYLALGIRK